MDNITILILILGGFIAGVINTFAGNGSAITLGMLTELVGLPANIANGTNRIGVLLQSTSSFVGLQKNKQLDVQANLSYIITVVLGAIMGAITSTLISNNHFTIVYKIMMVVLLITIFFKPSRWITPEASPSSQRPVWITLPVLFVVGFYGGFIQMGMGLIFLGVMVLLLKHDLLYANVLKVLVVSIFSIAVLAIFVYRGMVEWIPGITIATGQGLGGWVAGRYIAKSKKVNEITYYILVVVMISVIVKMFFFH